MNLNQLSATVGCNGGKSGRYRLNYCCKHFRIIVPTKMDKVNFFRRLNLRRSYLFCLVKLRCFVGGKDVHALSRIIKKVIIA